MARETPGDWDLSSFFSAPESADYADFVATLDADLDTASAELSTCATLSTATVGDWVERLLRIEELHGRLTHLEAYLVCLTSADSHDEWATREGAALDRLHASFEGVMVRARAALATAESGVFESLVADERMASARYFATRMRTKAAQAMPAPLEGLAAELGVDGLSAWWRLYGKVSGALTFELTDEEQPISVAMTRSLLEDPDPSRRQQVLSASNQAWSGVADILASCLNGIAGSRLTLYRHRGISDFLEPALFDAGIRRDTLEAMFDTVASRRELAQRYYRLKAKSLGMERLRFCDLTAPPAGETAESLSYDQARDIVLEAFSRYPELHQFAVAAFEKRWIDHQPRPGKRTGAFCIGSPILEQSRVFMTFGGTAGDVQTLAHELGHAFHGHIMKGMRYWATNYPMTLAETASTFAEALVTDTLLERHAPGSSGQLAMLDNKLADAATFMCNIPARFEFERSFYEERRHGEVSPSRLCELMVDAQRRCYGDALDPDGLNPYFWASKLHFYISDVSFYNFPYTFGFLFSLGIFARAKAEGPSFHATYERLLRETASGTAEEVAERCLGVKLDGPEFWNLSLDLIENDLEAYAAALAP